MYVCVANHHIWGSLALKKCETPYQISEALALANALTCIHLGLRDLSLTESCLGMQIRTHRLFEHSWNSLSTKSFFSFIETSLL